MHAKAGYDQASASERLLVERFRARTDRYQTLMTAAVERLGLASIDVTSDRSVDDLADDVIQAVTAQE
jgi:hypothetical protein